MNNMIENEEQRKIADNLRDVIIDRLNLHIKADEIQYDTQLFFEGLALDSVDALEVVAAIDEIYEVAVTQEDIQEFKNLITLSKLVLERR
jgi:acyl carrier protein